jgi:hypothetical protein
MKRQSVSEILDDMRTKLDHQQLSPLVRDVIKRFKIDTEHIRGRLSAAYFVSHVADLAARAAGSIKATQRFDVRPTPDDDSEIEITLSITIKVRRDHRLEGDLADKLAAVLATAAGGLPKC